MTARPRSLQMRLALGLGSGLTVLWILVTAIAIWVMSNEMDEVFDSGLQETAQRLLPLVVMDVVNQDHDKTQRVATIRSHEELLTYIVRDDHGHVLVKSHDAVEELFPANLGEGFSDIPGHRIYAEAALQGTVTILVAEPTAIREEAVMEAAAALAWPILVMLPLCLIATSLLLRQGIRPVLALSARIEARGAGDMTAIPVADLPIEIEPIATSVNRLVSRLGRALAAERSFTASSAHELRTPIAAALAQTQRLVAELQDRPGIERARQVEATLRDLARLSEKLMQLARAEGARLVAGEVHAVGPLIRLLADDFSRSTSYAGRVRLHLPAEPVYAVVDPDALVILMRNLIENALTHGVADGIVDVALDGQGRLVVANDGPVVPANQMERLMRPFERGPTMAKGTGLGLAIVDTIARGLGFGLQLESPAPGRDGGFAATISFKPAPSPSGGR